MSAHAEPEPSGMCADLLNSRLTARQSRTSRCRPFFFQTQKGEMIPCAVQVRLMEPGLEEVLDEALVVVAVPTKSRVRVRGDLVVALLAERSPVVRADHQMLAVTCDALSVVLVQDVLELDRLRAGAGQGEQRPVVGGNMRCGVTAVRCGGAAQTEKRCAGFLG